MDPCLAINIFNCIELVESGYNVGPIVAAICGSNHPMALVSKGHQSEVETDVLCISLIGSSLVNILNIPAALAMLPNGLDTNVTELLAYLLTKQSVFYSFAICIL